MKWINDNPKISGKYIVETITMMGNIRRLESYFNHTTGKWSFSNQKFNKYLKES